MHPLCRSNSLTSLAIDFVCFPPHCPELHLAFPQDLRVTVTFWSLSHLQMVAPLEFCWRFSIGSKEKSWLDFHLCPEH